MQATGYDINNLRFRGCQRTLNNFRGGSIKGHVILLASPKVDQRCLMSEAAELVQISVAY